jgi:PPM family protein phosphatase
MSAHRVLYAGVTDVGRQRAQNEDCVLLRPEHHLFAVADGMGGHRAGDVASHLASSSLGAFFDETAPTAGDFAGLAEVFSSATPFGARRLLGAVRRANVDIFARANGVLEGMGSTVVALHLADGAAHIAHVGDSRCYRIRDGEIQQMTRDHSLINDALDTKPELTKEELARLPTNIITRALGMHDSAKVDVRSERVLAGDAFLLCSDGLTGMVPDRCLLELAGSDADPRAVCEGLITEANNAGGTDNISAVLVRVEGAARRASRRYG